MSPTSRTTRPPPSPAWLATRRETPSSPGRRSKPGQARPRASTMSGASIRVPPPGARAWCSMTTAAPTTNPSTSRPGAGAPWRRGTASTAPRPPSSMRRPERGAPPRGCRPSTPAAACLTATKTPSWTAGTRQAPGPAASLRRAVCFPASPTSRCRPSTRWPSRRRPSIATETW